MCVWVHLLLLFCFPFRWPTILPQSRRKSWCVRFYSEFFRVSTISAGGWRFSQFFNWIHYNHSDSRDRRLRHTFIWSESPKHHQLWINVACIQFSYIWTVRFKFHWFDFFFFLFSFCSLVCYLRCVKRFFSRLVFFLLRLFQT